MQSRRRRLCLLATSAAAAALLTPCANAANIRFTNSSGGTFGTAANWASGTIPGASDIAEFGVATSGSGPAYGVNFTASTLNQALLIERDGVTFNLGGFTYTLTGAPASNPFIVGTASGEVGSLTLTNGTLITSATSSAFQSVIGQAAGSNGSVFLQPGATWTDTLEERIGQAGTALLSQSGGIHSTNGDLLLGTSATGAGIYLLNGTSAAASIGGNLYIGGTSTASAGSGLVSISSGTLSVANALRVWDATGSLSLTGGTLSVGSLNTSGNPGRFNWTAGTLRIATNLSIDSSGPFGNSLTLASGKTLSLANTLFVANASAGTLNVSGGTLTSTSSSIIGFFSSGTVNQSSGVVSLASQLVLGANSNTTGVYNLSGGTLTAGNGSGWGSSGVGVFTQTGGTAILGSVYLGQAALSNGLITVNDPTGLATLTFTSLYVGGQQSASGGIGNITILNSAVTVTDTLKIWNVAGSLTLSGGTLAVNTLDTNNNPARFNWTAGNFNYTNASGLLIDATGPLGGSLSLGATKNLAVNNNLTIGAAGSILLNGGAMTYGTLTLAGGFIGGSGAIVNNNSLSGFGTLTGSGGFTNNGALATNGVLVLANNATNNGAILLSTGQLQIAGVALSNPGFINLNSNTISGSGTLTNTAAGTLQGPGTISVANFSNAGLIALATGLLRTPSFTNAGAIVLDGAAATIATGPTITNAGSIQGRGKISAALINNASIDPTGGTLIIAGPLSNNASGLLSASLGNKLLITGAFPGNAGLISLSGGTFDTNGQSLANSDTGNITGYGILRTGGLTNDGAMTLSGGTSTINGDVTNNAGKTINLKYQPAIFTGNIVNYGIIKTTSTTVTFTGNYIGNTFISDPAINIFQAMVTIIPGGLMSGDVGDVYNFSGGTVDNQGTFSNGGALISADNFNNTGAFTQSGPQTWAPGAAFANAGTAAFASNAGSPAAPTLGITNTGSLTLASAQNLAALTITAGQATLTAGTTKTNALSFGGGPASTGGWTGKLDIAGNTLIVQATANKATALAILADQIRSGNNGGLWTGAGITSSTNAADSSHSSTLALIDNADLPGQTSFAGQAVDANSLIVTRAVLGDADLSGVVDLADFDIWFSHVGFSTYSYLKGDLNSDGIVDLADFDLWFNHVGFTGPSLTPAGAGPTSSSVPEPASLTLLAIGSMLLLRRKNRKAAPYKHNSQYT